MSTATSGRRGHAFLVTRVVTARPWARIERLTHTHPAFPEERIRPNGRQTEPGVVHAFGTETPPSRDVLLHFGPAWEQGKGPPVVLVHGATADASYWLDPYGRRGEGLLQALEAAGRRVFAVTFAHRHGDNLLWAESLAVAIARVREATGAEKVDVLGHSKGSVAARALASGLKADWMSGYGGDIRRLVIVGGPNMGLDYSFRHPLVNFGLYTEIDDPRLNAPMSWTGMIAYGRWVDTRDRTLLTTAGNYFPGQCQMLHRWDRRYALPRLEPDVHSTYYGGRGLLSESAGIEEAIAQGGHFIERLGERPLDDAITLAVLAGSRANRMGMLNEHTGPSDGTVFIESATATADMTRGGARLLAKDVLPLNHAELIYAPAARRWVCEALTKG